MMKEHFCHMGRLLATALLLTGCSDLPVSLAMPWKSDDVALVATATAEPTLQIAIPTRNANAPLSRVATNGGVETWMTADNISVSLRNGVLVASRGLGFDLMAADAQPTLAALDASDGPSYRRLMRYLNGENQSTYLTAECLMKDVGSVTVKERPLRRLEEACRAGEHQFTNVFWLDANNTIVMSRQWLSPEVGHLVINAMN